MDPHSRASKKNTSYGNEVLPQDMHLIQRPCYQLESLCQDPAGNQSTQRPPDHRKEMQTAVVWSCLPFIKSGHNHLARQWKGEEDKTDRRGGKTTSANGQALSLPRPRWVENSGKWRKLVVKLSVVPQQPSWLRYRRRWSRNLVLYQILAQSFTELLYLFLMQSSAAVSLPCAVIYFCVFSSCS